MELFAGTLTFTSIFNAALLNFVSIIKTNEKTKPNSMVVSLQVNYTE
jgi:hypothetical protein